MSKRKKIKSGLSKNYLFVPLSLSVALNVTGLAGLVDGVVVWIGFFKDAINLYSDYVRQPLMTATTAVWPPFFPSIPRIAYDLFVVWLAFGLGNVLSTQFVDWSELYGDEWSKKEDFFLGIKGTAINIVLGPLGPILAGAIALLSFIPFTKMSDIKPEERAELQKLEQQTRIAKSLFFKIIIWHALVFGLFFLALFINYQVARVR